MVILRFENGTLTLNHRELPPEYNTAKKQYTAHPFQYASNFTRNKTGCQCHSEKFFGKFLIISFFIGCSVLSRHDNWL
jgi:hypothetical protein